MTTEELKEKQRNSLLELQSKLKITPVISKFELLDYIIKHNPTIDIEIITEARVSYHGNVIFIGKTTTEEEILIFRIFGKYDDHQDQVVYIPLHKVELIQFLNESDALDVLSKGKMTKSEAYEISGKLEVRRGFKEVEEYFNKTHNFSMEVAEMILPTEGKPLNRILKLTQFIQEVIDDIVKEQDALDSWKDRYRKLEFIENDTLKVLGRADTIQIFFDFSNIHAPEIDKKKLKDSILEVL